MAAAVNLGKEFSPKKLFLLEYLQASSCLCQGGGRPDNPGSKYILSLPSPSPHPRQSQLNASRLEPDSSPAEPPWVHLHTDVHPSLVACPVAAGTSPCWPALPWMNLPAKQAAPRDQQISEQCPKFTELTDSVLAPRRLMIYSCTSWNHELCQLLPIVNINTTLNLLSVISLRQKGCPDLGFCFGGLFSVW